MKQLSVILPLYHIICHIMINYINFYSKICVLYLSLIPIQ